MRVTSSARWRTRRGTWNGPRRSASIADASAEANWAQMQTHLERQAGGRRAPQRERCARSVARHGKQRAERGVRLSLRIGWPSFPTAHLSPARSTRYACTSRAHARVVPCRTRGLTTSTVPPAAKGSGAAGAVPADRRRGRRPGAPPLETIGRANASRSTPCASANSTATCSIRDSRGRNSAASAATAPCSCDPTVSSAGVMPAPPKARWPHWAMPSGRCWAAVFAGTDGDASVAHR